jgi:hypothetical protein
MALTLVNRTRDQKLLNDLAAIARQFGFKDVELKAMLKMRGGS